MYEHSFEVDKENAKVTSFTLYENPVTHEKLEVAIPLESRLDMELVRREIGLHDYVDLDTFQMQKIAAMLWAAKNVEKLLPGSKSIDLAFFGGGAFKLACSSSNGKGPFARTIGDVDLVTTRENGRATVQLLCKMHEVCGNTFLHAVTADDKRFNNMREGKRFRLRTIKQIEPDGSPIFGFADVFCEKLTFCHDVPVRDALKESSKNNFTIGLERMIISKAQYIKKIPEEDAAEIDKSRVLGKFDDRNLLVGMEPKDMLDVAAVLHDYEVGLDPRTVNAEKLAIILRSDWRLHKTVFMNLENLRRNLSAIVGVRVTESELSVMCERLDRILRSIAPEERNSFSQRLSFRKQWWEDVEDQVLAGARLH